MAPGQNQPEDAERLGLIGGEALRSALGYRTGEAFRAAARAGRVPVKLVKLEGRRGWFARKAEVHQWRAAVHARFEPGASLGEPAAGPSAQEGTLATKA